MLYPNHKYDIHIIVAREKRLQKVEYFAWI